MILPPWDASLSPSEAMALQERLSAMVVTETDPGLGGMPCQGMLIGGADCSTKRGETRGLGGIVVMEYPSFKVVERAVYEGKVYMPYIPGLLSFRELPLLLGAFERLKTKPQVIMVDGNGVAHPRGLGIASHLGITIGIPTVGCAKSRLLGTHEEPAPQRGGVAWWFHKGKRIGAVLRTRERVKPVYVSVGHRVGLDSALMLVLESAPRYRLPEPIREAHKTVSG